MRIDASGLDHESLRNLNSRADSRRQTPEDRRERNPNRFSESAQVKNSQLGEEIESGFDDLGSVLLADLPQAVAELDSELQVLSLSAQMQGCGPGLTVLLKTAEGAPVRELGLVEFWRLRGRSRGSPSLVGKILDRRS